MIQTELFMREVSSSKFVIYKLQLMFAVSILFHVCFFYNFFFLLNITYYFLLHS